MFRSRLEARWAAFFDLAAVAWEYEPDRKRKGWWPDFLVKGIRLDGNIYDLLSEVKPVAFSPIAIDPAFKKALDDKWTLMLGAAPYGDYVGFLACKRDQIVKTIGVRLTDDGLEGAALNRSDYGSLATKLWNQTNDIVINAGVARAINNVLQKQMGKRMFHFDERPDGRGVPDDQANSEG